MVQSQPFVFTSVQVISFSWNLIPDFSPTFNPSVFWNTREIWGSEDSVIPVGSPSCEIKATEEEN